MSAIRPRARVALRPRRLWTVRFSLGLTRWLLYAAAAVGVTATVRNAIDPPVRRTVEIVTRPVSDARSAWFALSFARAYLSWSSDPSVQERDLGPFIAPTGDQDGGLTPAPDVAQHVSWAGIAAEQNGPDGTREYTVALATAHRVQYVAVAVVQGPGGLPMLGRYPALVGPPAFDENGDLDGESLPSITNGAASAVLVRAMRNYIGGSSENLAADLAPGALLQPAAPGLTPLGVQRLALQSSGSVLVTLRAADAQGDVFTLAYQVSLVELHGRWEITRIGS